MSSVLITPPAIEPITVAQARLHLKEDTVGADIDAQIALAITAVRQLCENDCRRAFISQQWKTTLNAFPGGTYNEMCRTDYPAYDQYFWRLPRTPIISVDAISYIDSNNVSQSWDVTSAGILTDLNEGIVKPAYNTRWPGTQQQSPVSITYTAGYGTTAASVPAGAVQWMLMNLGTVYEMRQAEMVVVRASLIQSKFVDRLLDPIRQVRF